MISQKGNFSSKPLSIEEEYEDTISKYISNGYRINHNQTINTELKKFNSGLISREV